MKIAYTVLDRVFAQYIRLRDQSCRVCGRADRRLEAAHIISRKIRAVRYDPENVYLMCGGPSPTVCHRYMDTHETEKQAWWCAQIGEARAALVRFRATTGKKPDTALLLLTYRRLIKELS